MKICEIYGQHLAIVQKLNEMKNTHPNIFRLWIEHISEKRNEYLMSLNECNTMFEIVSEYKMPDMSMNDILFLKTISEIMRENKI